MRKNFLKWKKIALGGYQTVTRFPEKLTLEAKTKKQVLLKRGRGRKDLVIYYPYNYSTQSFRAKDSQEELVEVVAD